MEQILHVSALDSLVRSLIMPLLRFWPNCNNRRGGKLGDFNSGILLLIRIGSVSSQGRGTEPRAWCRQATRHRARYFKVGFGNGHGSGGVISYWGQIKLFILPYRIGWSVWPKYQCPHTLPWTPIFRTFPLVAQVLRDSPSECLSCFLRGMGGGAMPRWMWGGECWVYCPIACPHACLSAWMGRP